MSVVRKIPLEVKWRVENIQSWLQQRDDALYSPQFLVETLTNTRWKLSLTPNWQLVERYVSLTLQRDVEDDGPELIDLRCELSFLTSDGSPLKSKSCTRKFAQKTVSHELNVKQSEILVEKKETYLPEGVLTVCCKLWNTWSTVSKGQLLSLRSVIGTKCINVNATIDNFTHSSYAVVNLMSPSTDINLISLNIFVNPNELCWGEYEFVFKRNLVQCKQICWYSFKLFALGIGECKKEIFELFNFKNPADHHYEKLGKYLSNNTLNLQLEVSYHPAVTSECTESEFYNQDNLFCEGAYLENLEPSDSEKVHSTNADCLPSTDPYLKDGQFSAKDECVDVAGNKCLPSTTLKEDMTSLFNDRLFCDTKIQTDTETFPIHRSILSARSPVFKKMFTTNMKEMAGECINVSDISSDTVRRMLQFLYTDCTGNLEIQSAKDLYVASDLYDIASLKQRCSSFMKKNLCPANVCEVIVLADMHQDKDLESAAHEFVLANDEEVFYSDEWKLFMKNSGGLAAQVMYLKFTKK